MAFKLRLDQLEKLARDTGYEDYKSMLVELYAVQRLSLAELAARCGISTERLKRHLARYGLTLRGRGGANNVKVVITPELRREVLLDGVPAVAKRLGVSPLVLYTKMVREAK